MISDINSPLGRTTDAPEEKRCFWATLKVASSTSQSTYLPACLHRPSPLSAKSLFILRVSRIYLIEDRPFPGLGKLRPTIRWFISRIVKEPPNTSGGSEPVRRSDVSIMNSNGPGFKRTCPAEKKESPLSKLSKWRRTIKVEIYCKKPENVEWMEMGIEG